MSIGKLWLLIGLGENEVIVVVSRHLPIGVGQRSLHNFNWCPFWELQRADWVSSCQNYLSN